MAPAEPGSGAASYEEEKRGGGVDVARPPRSSTGYCGVGVGHLAALLAGCQAQ